MGAGRGAAGEADRRVERVERGATERSEELANPGARRSLGSDFRQAHGASKAGIDRHWNGNPAARRGGPAAFAPAGATRDKPHVSAAPPQIFDRALLAAQARPRLARRRRPSRRRFPASPRRRRARRAARIWSSARSHSPSTPARPVRTQRRRSPPAPAAARRSASRRPPPAPDRATSPSLSATSSGCRWRPRAPISSSRCWRCTTSTTCPAR